MNDIGLPILILGGIAVLIWCALLAGRLSRSNYPRIMSVLIWVVTILSCASALAYRAKAEALSNALLLGGTALTAAAFIGVILGARVRVRGPAMWLVIFGCAYAVVQVVSMLLNGPFVPTVVSQILALTFMPGALLLIAGAQATREQLLRLALHISAFVVTASVILGVVAPALAYGHDYGDVRRFPVFGLEWRLAGITPHQNLLSMTALIAIIVAFGIKSRLRWLIAAVSLLAIGMAESRNAAVTLVIMVIIWWIFSARVRLVRLLALAPLTAVIFALGGPSALLTEESSTTAGGLTADVGTFNTRTTIWNAIWQHLPERPIFGWGPLAFQQSSTSPFPVLQFRSGHSQFMHALAEGGVVGFALTAAFVGTMAWIAIKHHRQPMYLALFVALAISMVTEAFFTVHLYGLSYAAIPAILSLLVFMSADAKPLPESDPTLPVKAARAVGPRPYART